MLRNTTPIYDTNKKNYYCPVCDRKLHYRTIMHRNCGVHFIWNTPRHAILVKHNIHDFLHPKDLTITSIANFIHLSVPNTSKILHGEQVIHPEVRDYLIVLLENQIVRLKRILRTLKDEKKGEW